MSQSTFDGQSDQQNGGAAWLTVSEAAQAIGVSERTLRRHLRAEEHRHETQAGTRTERRQTNTGARDATVLAPPFVETLTKYFDEQDRARSGAKNADREARQKAGANTGATAAQTQAETPGTPAPDDPPPFKSTLDTPGEMLTPANDMRLAMVYERLIKSKDEQINSLTARLESLEAALQRSQENEARAQTLHAMQPGQSTLARQQPGSEEREETKAAEPAQRPPGPTLPPPGIWRLLYRLVNYKP
jgi:hypothetical protein